MHAYNKRREVIELTLERLGEINCSPKKKDTSFLFLDVSSSPKKLGCTHG
jgi:hypothetical protein